LFNHRLNRLKDSSHKLQVNYAVSFYFYLYLILHICAVKFDVTKNFKKFLVFRGSRPTVVVWWCKRDAKRTRHFGQLLSDTFDNFKHFFLSNRFDSS